MSVNIKELNGRTIKKALNAKRVSKRWHNHNNSGGNFGIDIVPQDGQNMELTGNHNTSDIVTILEFGPQFSLGQKIITPSNYQDVTIDDILTFLQTEMGVAPTPAKINRSDRDKDATITDLNGIKFVDYTNNEFQPAGMEEHRQHAKDNILKRSDSLKSKGFKRVELDSYGGYHRRGITKGRFVQLTTMHMLRLMKR